MATKTDFFKIGQISGGQAPDIAEAVKTGLEAGFKPFFEWQKKEKAWKESIAPKLAKIGEDYSPTLVDEGQRATMTAALQESRLKYADILKQTRNMDPTSEEYIRLMGQATDIAAGFNKTFELGREFTQLGNEFALLAQNDNLSRGMTAEKRAGLSQIFVNGKYKVKRDPVTGQMSYIVTENIKGSEPGGDLNIAGMEFTHDELDDFRQPNQTFVNGYLAINENFSKLGEAGKKLNTESAEYKSGGFELQKAISNMSIEELRSLATDSFIDGKPVAVFSQEEGDIFNMTKEQLGPMVYDKLMNNLLATNATNYQAPAPKEKETSSYDQALSLYNQLKQDPIGYFEAYTGVAPSWDRKTNIVEIYEGGELQFKYDLNNPAQRGGFYKQLLDASDYLKGTSAKEEEIRRIFDMLVMGGARGSSPTTFNTTNTNKKDQDDLTDQADQAFMAESFSTERLEVPKKLSSVQERQFINKLSETATSITEKGIANLVYNSDLTRPVEILGKTYKPKSLYQRDIELSAKEEQDFQNLFEASDDVVTVNIQNKYINNEFLNQLEITDISQLTYKDIERIKLLEKTFYKKERSRRGEKPKRKYSLEDIKRAEAQQKFQSNKL